MYKFFAIMFLAGALLSGCAAQTKGNSVPAIDNPAVTAEIERNYQESFKILNHIEACFKEYPEAAVCYIKRDDYSADAWSEFDYRLKEAEGKYSHVEDDSMDGFYGFKKNF